MSSIPKKPEEERPKPPEEKRPKTPDSEKDRPDTRITGVKPSEAARKAKKERELEEGEKKLPVDGDWISGRTDDTLVRLITAFAVELKTRAQGMTQRKLVDRPLPDIKTDIEVKEFVRLPAASKKKLAEIAATTWRIILYGDRPGDKPLGLEIHDDIMIGRAVDEGDIDLDLTEYDAEELGVSRKHAMLRPTRDRLLLSDLGSTNGTDCEGERVKPDAPVEVKDGNTLSFGKLHFKVKIVSQPKKPAK